MSCRRFFLPFVLVLALVPDVRAQEGSSIPDEYRGTEAAVARGILDGNLIECNFRNYTEISETPDVQFGVWPRGTGNRHIDGIGMSVAGQVRGHRAKYPQFYGGRPDTVLNPISMNYFYGRTISPYGRIWGWLPLPGFHDPLRFNPITGEREPTPALSDDASSWPAFWPDKLADPEDSGWRNDAVDADPNRAAWNGFFGKGVFNADLESYFVVDDLGAQDYHLDPNSGRPFSEFGVFYPDPSDSTKGGLGLQVAMRIFQWANVLAEDAMFIVYRITNVGQTHYGQTLDLPCFQGENGAGQRVVTRPCETGLHMTQFSDFGLGWEETDESSAYDPQLDIAFGWDHDGLGIRPNGGRYTLGVPGFAFLESPVNRDDGLDNDEDGLTDEDRFSGPGLLLEGQDAIRAYVQANYDLTDFERALGPLEDRRAFQAGRWWTGDEDLDWLAYEDKNANGSLDQGELVNDDYGRDGIGPYDPGYPGPDAGEADARPTPGEPNFDQTDVEEGDQIGLTGIHLSSRPFYTDGVSMKDDTWMWARIVENQFPLGTRPHRQAADVEPWITWNSGPIQLQPQQTDFFSTAWLFGTDEEDFLRNRRVVQDIYDADYRFAQPPILPRLKAQAGDGYVILSWDTLSLASYDRFTQEHDFEGYKLYRGTDPLLSDARTITDFTGTPMFYEPIAQWDRKNGIRGPRTVLEGRAVYDLGQDTGLEFAYIDRDVVNGKTYYYALVAYDRGFVPEEPTAQAIDPQENTFNVSIDQAGQVRGTSPNVAVVTPRSRAAGYVEAATNEDLSRPHGSTRHAAPLGTGSISVTVVDFLDVPPDALFRLSFHDSSTSIGSTYQTTAFSLENRTTHEILLQRQAMAPSSPATAGLLIDFFNDELALWPQHSGWRGTDGTGQPTTHTDPRRLDDYTTTWQVSLAVDPSDLVKLTADEYRIDWVDPADSLYRVPRIASRYPQLQIPLYCFNETRQQPCDLVVDDLNRSGTFDAADALIVAEKECRFCTHVFRFRATFSVPEGDEDIAPEAGNRLVMRQRRPFGEGDFFEFTVRAPHVDTELAGEELKAVAVVPNPYVAAAAWEAQTQLQGRGPRQVQFIHLPEACVIRIYTMRGELVRVLRHEGVGGDGAAWWDLKTEAGQEVSYGVYLFHVEAPGIGETTGKFAIVK